MTSPDAMHNNKRLLLSAGVKVSSSPASICERAEFSRSMQHSQDIICGYTEDSVFV